jgi:chemotaxis protein MotA
MFVIIGIIAVIVCVIGSYMAMGGKLAVLNQPFEVTLIFGAGISAFVIGNPIRVVKGTRRRITWNC